MQWFVEEVYSKPNNEVTWSTYPCHSKCITVSKLSIMWRFLRSKIAIKQSKKLFCGVSCKSVRLFSIKNAKNGGVLRYTFGSCFTMAGMTFVGAAWNSDVLSKTLEEANCEEEFTGEAEMKEPDITLYQFASCPFCNKVRAFLDYYGMKYTIVEVDPLFKKELKSLEYRKVPIVVIQGIQVSG